MKKGNYYKRLKEILKESPRPRPDRVIENDEILAILFAPGSNGLPDSSLGYALSASAKPELRQYVESHLMKPVGSSVSPTACNDPDTALDLIVPFDMQLGRSRQQIGNYYLDKIKGFSNSKSD